MGAAGAWTLRRVETPALDWYRDLFRRVGEDWLWISRARMPDAVTLPQHFKNHGYHSFSLGKIFPHSQQEPGDDLPNGRAMAIDWIRQLRAALGR